VTGGLTSTCLVRSTVPNMGRGFGLVVSAVGWHAGDPGSILSRDGFYTFGLTCIPQRFRVCFGVNIALYKTLMLHKTLMYSYGVPFITGSTVFVGLVVFKPFVSDTMLRQQSVGMGQPYVKC
jgi:hypothetical protein